jgi:pimeloyl-ACP methyl ester carboxylesterase
MEKVPAFAQKLENEHGDKWKDLLVSTAEMLRGMGENPPLSQAVLEKIQAPILLMCGDRDETAVPLENLKTYHTLKDLKKTVELAILPNTVHAIEKIPTTLTNNILELFLNRY